MPATVECTLMNKDRFLKASVHRTAGFRLALLAALSATALLTMAIVLAKAQETVQTVDQNSSALPVVEPPATPDFAVVQSTIGKSIARRENYQDGDLICQSQVRDVLDAVARAGWDVPNRDAILKRVLADGSFLIKEASTPAGRSFMRRVGRHAGAFGRLERLSTISGGERLIRDLIRQKDGDKLIEYMATTPGGQNMGRMAANSKNGIDLNKPTGRLYTANELVSQLDQLYRAQFAKNLQKVK